MKTIAALLLLASLATPLSAADAPPPIAIGLQPLGDGPGGVVVRMTFRFAVPAEAPEDGALFLQGSLLQEGKVVRNFRYAVPSEQRDAVEAIQTVPQGETVVEARLIAPMDEGVPLLLAKGSASFAVVPTGSAYVATPEDGAEAVLAEGVLPESVGSLSIRTPRRDVALNLFIVEAEVQPPVKRVEFWVGEKKVLARNAPPYTAELDLGKLPKRVEVRVVGYDAAGRYVDADAFVVNERDTPLEVKITRTVTGDGVSHIKLSVQDPKAAGVANVTLYAGDRKLREWDRPPYAIDLPASSLAGVEFVRASAVDRTGYEATDLLFLSGNRYMESIEVNLVELPVSVLTAEGAVVTGLEQKDFTVLENGKPQAISSFNFAAKLPLSIGVLLDYSGSMEKRMADARAAAISFFRSIIKPGDRAFFGAFASDPARTAPFVSSIATLESQVESIPEAGGGTALYDAIVTGLYRFRNVQGRKALVVITDGEDTTSRLESGDMLTYARASRVPLYFIGIGLRVLGGGGKLRSLAEETGGNAYFVRDARELGDAYRRLEEDLRSQYLLSYESQSSSKDQEYRAVDVKVARDGAKVRTIRGYIP